MAAERAPTGAPTEDERVRFAGVFESFTAHRSHAVRQCGNCRPQKSIWFGEWADRWLAGLRTEAELGRWWGECGKPADETRVFPARTRAAT